MNNIIFSKEAGTDLFHFLHTRHYSKVAVLVDDNTYQYCYPLISEHLPDHIIIKVSSGEHHKNINTCIYIWEQLTEHHFDRKGVLINLGGGVIGDMGGFCARTYKRGIDFINIPTTLLAQVDASVGGKLGIDFNHLKNHIGLFHEPAVVLIDDRFLKTLPTTELRSGFAEVIKHHLIRDGKGWLELQRLTFPHLNWPTIIKHSVKIKEQIVREDPQESGLRKILNFGHTVGHAIESYMMGGISAILHGEAVAAGMICESWIANQLGLISQADLLAITTYINQVYPKIGFNIQDIDHIVRLAVQDKKNKGDKILMVLLDTPGNASYDTEVSTEMIAASLQFYIQM